MTFSKPHATPRDDEENRRDSPNRGPFFGPCGEARRVPIEGECRNKDDTDDDVSADRHMAERIVGRPFRIALASRLVPNSCRIPRRPRDGFRRTGAVPLPPRKTNSPGRAIVGAITALRALRRLASALVRIDVLRTDSSAGEAFQTARGGKTGACVDFWPQGSIEPADQTDERPKRTDPAAPFPQNDNFDDQDDGKDDQRDRRFVETQKPHETEQRGEKQPDRTDETKYRETKDRRRQQGSTQHVVAGVGRGFRRRRDCRRREGTVTERRHASPTFGRNPAPEQRNGAQPGTEYAPQENDG